MELFRKNEIKSLEERTEKDNKARIADIAKLDGKLDSENNARKEEIKSLDSWAKSENDSRKKEIDIRRGSIQMLICKRSFYLVNHLQ